MNPADFGITDETRHLLVPVLSHGELLEAVPEINAELIQQWHKRGFVPGIGRGDAAKGQGRGVRRKYGLFHCVYLSLLSHISSLGVPLNDAVGLTLKILPTALPLFHLHAVDALLDLKTETKFIITIHRSEDRFDLFTGWDALAHSFEEKHVVSAGVISLHDMTAAIHARVASILQRKADGHNGD